MPTTPVRFQALLKPSASQHSAAIWALSSQPSVPQENKPSSSQCSFLTDSTVPVKISTLSWYRAPRALDVNWNIISQFQLVSPILLVPSNSLNFSTAGTDIVTKTYSSMIGCCVKSVIGLPVCPTNWLDSTYPAPNQPWLVHPLLPKHSAWQTQWVRPHRARFSEIKRAVKANFFFPQYSNAKLDTAWFQLSSVVSIWQPVQQKSTFCTYYKGYC